MDGHASLDCELLLADAVQLDVDLDECDDDDEGD